MKLDNTQRAGGLVIEDAVRYRLRLPGAGPSRLLAPATACAYLGIWKRRRYSSNRRKRRRKKGRFISIRLLTRLNGGILSWFGRGQVPHLSLSPPTPLEIKKVSWIAGSLMPCVLDGAAAKKSFPNPRLFLDFFLLLPRRWIGRLEGKCFSLLYVFWLFSFFRIKLDPNGQTIYNKKRGVKFDVEGRPAV